MKPFGISKRIIVSMQPKGNTLLVELEDISPEFVPSARWENFGGIIRGVKIEYLPEEYIADVFFHSELKNNYADAEYTVEVTTVPADLEYTAKLSYNGEIVDSISIKSLDNGYDIAFYGVFVK